MTYAGILNNLVMTSRTSQEKLVENDVSFPKKKSPDSAKKKKFFGVTEMSGRSGYTKIILDKRYALV